MPLLWALRELVGLTGTKYGCGIGQCGACTVHIDGNPVRSCLVPAAALVGTQITTIEGISKDNSHPLQKAWAAVDVPQCGYCQSGQIMAAVALLKTTAKPIWGGVGEPTICVVAPAVLNAIHAATGKPVRHLPLKNQGFTFA